MPNGLVPDVPSGVRDKRNRCDRQEVWERAIRFFGSHSAHDAPLHWSRLVGGWRQLLEGWTIQDVEVLSETLRRGAA